MVLLSIKSRGTKTCVAFFAAFILASVLATIEAQPVSSDELAQIAAGKGPATTALQMAIDNSTGLVDIPAGTYLIDQTLTVDLKNNGYRGIRGADGATRIVMSGPGPAFRVVGDHQGTADPGSIQEHTWEKERFPLIGGIEIIGTHPEADGIELFRTMQCTIRNVSIRNCRYGIHLVERNRNFILADSHIYDGGDTGVFLDNCNLHQVNIIGNHISYNKRAGIRQLNGDVHNIQITGNDIEYNSGSNETSGEIVLEASTGLISEYTIVSNTIQARPDNQGANIRIIGSKADSPYAARTIVITGNVIGSRDKNIVLENACRVTITGNTIYGGKTLNIDCKQVENVILNGTNIGTRPSMHAVNDVYDDGVIFEDCKSCIISNAILSQNRYGTKEQGGALTLINSQDCRISGCQIIHPKIRGIHIVGGEGCVVSDNTIAAEASGDFLAAIEVSDNGKSHVIHDNLIRSALSDPILTHEASVHSKDNIVVNPE